MNTAIATGSDIERGNVGIGFAVPINTVKNVAAQLIEHGKVERAHLGVEVQPIDEQLAELFRLPVDHGLIVQQVGDGSGAQEAGLRAGTTRVVVAGESYVLGGDIIVKVGDTEVRTLQQLRDAITAYKPGDKVDLEIYRGDDAESVEVRLGQQPQSP